MHSVPRARTHTLWNSNKRGRERMQRICLRDQINIKPETSSHVDGTESTVITLTRLRVNKHVFCGNHRIHRRKNWFETVLWIFIETLGFFSSYYRLLLPLSSRIQRIVKAEILVRDRNAITLARDSWIPAKFVTELGYKSIERLL
ncbi:uncharacterized protein LOC117235928 [Bombus vosnesenskii]|uniref:Uncharacterized protein LOC117235928 n=2 Tax=Pyrobombus TaxID=144703 RepID=A0A6J3KR20_9HYME|nr:uncharacterized protein LOC117235928 [Bombus vosnesenskii]